MKLLLNGDEEAVVCASLDVYKDMAEELADSDPDMHDEWLRIARIAGAIRDYVDDGGDL